LAFAVGERVLYRGVHVDESRPGGAPVIVALKPMVCVEDSERLSLLFLPCGSPTVLSRPLNQSQPKPWGPGEYELTEATWARWNTLFVHVPGAWHSAWVQFSPGWEFLGWYVNFEEPLRRTEQGFDNRDLQLDILVAADRSWRWKDEDDFARSIACGLISEEVAQRVRAEANAVVAAIESGAWPFNDDLATWRPATPVNSWPVGLADLGAAPDPWVVTKFGGGE